MNAHLLKRKDLSLEFVGFANLHNGVLFGFDEKHEA